MNDTSQYQEGRFILDHFAGHVGRFLDVGAFDGVTFSNTHMLAEAGWSGVCVEPSPPAFCYLMKTHAGNERIELVNAAILPHVPLSLSGAESKMMDFHVNTADGISADALSTFMESHVVKCSPHPFRKIKVPVVTWEGLIPDPAEDVFDFINIDVEGLNAGVLEECPLQTLWQVRMLCVELDPKEKVLAVMERNTMQARLPHRKIIGGNLLAWRD